jgi:hypothetical protein
MTIDSREPAVRWADGERWPWRAGDGPPAVGRLRGRGILVVRVATADDRSATRHGRDRTGRSGRRHSDAVVRDVATGADVNVRALAASDRPTLYWFWAPH